MYEGLPVTVEKSEEGVMAYNDELRVIATGATVEEAMANFKDCLAAHINAFGKDVLKPLLNRQYGFLEMPQLDSQA